MTRIVSAAVLLAAILACGCSSGSPAPATPAGPPPEPVSPLDVAANRIVQVLTNIQNEETAQESTLTLRTATASLSAAGKESVAAAKPDAPQGLPPAAERVLAALERLAKAPYAAVIRKDLDAVLAATADMVPPADRPKYDEELKKRGLAE